MDGSAFPGERRRRKRQFVVALILIATAAGMLLLKDTNAQPAFDTLRNWGHTLMAPVRWIGSLPQEFARMRQASLDEDALRIEHSELLGELQKQRVRLLQFDALREENARVRKLLGATSQLSARLLLVDVARARLHPYTHRLVLAAGEAAGLRAGQAVLGVNGVIGEIKSAARQESLVVLATEAEHAIPALLLRNGAQTIVHGLGEPRRFKVSWLPHNTDIRVGDQLVTSGLGGRYPRGYPLATVTKVGHRPGEQFLEVFAKPLADARNHTEVVVVLGDDTK